MRGGDVRTFRRWTTLVRPQRFLPLLTALPPSMKCCVTKLDLSDNESCSAAGAGRCLACPANANSAAGSDAVTDCVCNAGYYGPGGDSCATCDAGSWCPGGATITPCPDHMISAPGSDSLSDCTCKEGYSAGLSVEGALCEATDVSREVSTITLAVTLSMSASEFNSQMRRSAYIDGVARALKVESSAVQIKSVQEQSSERRRRLLATTCLVETTVTVRSSIISVVRSRATVENLNAALAGNLNAEVVSADVVDEPSAVYIYVAGGVGGAFVLVGVGVLMVLWKKRNSTVPQTVALARVVAEPLTSVLVQS